MEKDKTIIIIPTFNEEKTINKIYIQAKKHCLVLIVDDASSDGTSKILNSKKMNFLRNKKNIGYEASTIKGIKYAIKYYKNLKYLVTLDADGELPVNSISKLQKQIKKNNLDILVGYRDKMNRFTEIILSYLYKLKFNVNDPVCGLKIYKIEILKKAIKKVSNNLFLVDILTFASCRNYLIKNFKIKVKKRKDNPRVGNFFQSNLKIIRIILHTFFSKKSY